MDRKKIIIVLCAAVLLQIMVLSGMLVLAAMPLWTGKEIRVKVVPVDPRSLFRGNYARLNYDFSRLEKGALGGEREENRRRDNEVVYITLRENQDGLYEYAAASLEKPDAGVFLRGRIDKFYFVTYGIEAFFAQKERALKLEKDLQNGNGIAVLMVTGGGKAALKSVKAGKE